MFGHRRSPANAAPDNASDLAHNDRTPAPAARALAADGCAFRFDASTEGNTRIPLLPASSVLAVIGSANEPW